MRQAVLGAAVLAIGVLIARGPRIVPLWGGNQIAGRRELLAYRLTQDPLIFDLPQGRRNFRVLVNLDLPKHDAAPVPLSVRVAIPRDGRDQVFAMTAAPPPVAADGPDIFYLGEDVQPAWTREIHIERTHDDPAKLILSLVEPTGGSASIRVLARQERAPLAHLFARSRRTARARRRMARRHGPLAWHELAGNVQAQLVKTHWVRLPAAAGASSRRLYLRHSHASAPREPGPHGDALAPGQALAYTVRGPGVLRLEALGAALVGSYRITDADTDHEETLSLAAHDSLDIPVGGGVATVRLTSDSRAHVAALVSTASMALPGARLVPRPDGDLVLRPAAVFERVVETATTPTGRPVSFELADRHGAPLRLVARTIARDGSRPRLSLSWTYRNGTDHASKGGNLTETLGLSPEDRLKDHSDALLSRPLTVYLWPPRDATAVEVRSDPPAFVSAASPADDSPPTPAVADIPPHFRLLGAVGGSHTWYEVHAIQEDELAAAGRLDHLIVPTRLEAKAPLSKEAARTESLIPHGAALRRVVLLPGPKRKSSSPPAHGWWPFEAGREARFTQASALASVVPPSLLYIGHGEAGGGTAQLRLDAGSPITLSLFAARGEVSLPRAASRAKRFRVDVATPMQLFVNRPLAGVTPDRVRSVFELVGGRLDVTVNKGREPRTVGFVVYRDAGPRAVELRVRVDHGVRKSRPGSISRTYTRLLRTLSLQLAPLAQSLFLNARTRTISSSKPIFVRLGDDLQPGRHIITVEAAEPTPGTFVRFFAYGAKPVERLSQVGEMRVEEE